MKIPINLTILLLFFTSTITFSQEHVTEGKDIKVETVDGTIIIGNVNNITDSTLAINTRIYGDIILKTEDIDRIVNYTASDKWPFNNYNSSQYLATHSGFNIKKGEHYYHNIALAFNNFAFGLTDYLSLTVGTEILTPFLGQFPISHITPKVSIPIKVNGVQIGAAGFSNTFAIYHNDDYWNDSATNFANFFHQNLTYGNRQNNITLGFGIVDARVGREYRNSDHATYTANLSGAFRLGKRLSLISDNIYVMTENNYDNYANENFLLASLAIRIHNPKRNGSTELGFWIPTTADNDTPALIFFSFVRFLNYKRITKSDQELLLEFK